MNTHEKLFIVLVLGLSSLAIPATTLMTVPDVEAQKGPCTNPNPNSACSFAPGHGGTPPGQTGDPRANAPGQLK